MAGAVCRHVETARLQPPSSSQSVYKEDCTQCFDDIDAEGGLDVCLHCFNGGCTGDNQHASSHATMYDHPLSLNIRRTRKPISKDEPPRKITKLAILAESDEDRYVTDISVICHICKCRDIEIQYGDGGLGPVVDGIMRASTFAKQQEVKAWEQEFTSCEHILTLQQQSTRNIASQDLGHCSMCDLQENLWLCLECGNLGCGRAQFGGVGGHSHGLAHSDSSGHGVAVKLGSITPEGTADVYCYKCNEERIDDDLGKHLAHWGILLADRQKTEMTLMEMQVEQNLKWDFTMTSEDGTELMKAFGAGTTGIKNLGNSCYLASTLQCLFSLPQFKDRYYRPNDEMPTAAQPAQDLETQMRKMGDGLSSGRYSMPTVDQADENALQQRGIAPSMLKHLIGRGHAEFSTMRQQDAFEFLLHLFKLVTRSSHTAEFPDPTQDFRFLMEHRLQCIGCKKVRYSTDEQDNLSIAVPMKKRSVENSATEDVDEYMPVTLKECLDSYTAPEVVELTCSDCGSKDGFTKRSLFKTFPEVLIVNARRFILKNWVPTKVDVAVIVGETPHSFDDYKSYGLQPDEQLLSDDQPFSGKSDFVPNEMAKEQLEGMGFPVNRAIRALHATGNQDANAAMEWLFAHMDDADIDDPLKLSAIEESSSVESVTPEQIELMGSMGFSASQARKALRETGGDMERAVDWLFNHPDDQGDMEEDITSTAVGVASKSVPGSDELPAHFQLQSLICHKGGSIHAGHYVAFVRREFTDSARPDWILFNDEKVVHAADIEEMKKFAYVYFFTKYTKAD